MEKTTVKIGETKILNLGHCGENFARQVAFDVSEWETVYGDGVAELLYQRKGDERPYVMEITREAGKVLWPITAWHTEVPGHGKCELRYYQGKTLVKSAVWKTSVHAALETPAEEAPTEAEQGWLERMLQTAAAAESAAAQAETAAQEAATEKEAAETAAKNAESVAEEVNRAAGDAAAAKQQAESAAEQVKTEKAAAAAAAKSAQSAAEAAQSAVKQAAAGVPQDMVRYTAQSLTEAQQAQARENIGAVASWADLPDKPFGETEEVVLPESLVTFAWSEADSKYVAAVYDTSVVAKKNAIYKVIWDGTAYICSSVDVSAIIPNTSYIGNASTLGLEDTGEPFFIMIQGGNAYGFFDVYATKEMTRSIVIFELMNRSIDSKFLPRSLRANELILTSTTDGSEKCFKLTVDDSGAIQAVELVT